MSFLTNFDDDIFISHAHTDNQSLIDGQLGWVDFFREALEKRLQLYLEPKPQIAQDPKLHGSDFFADSLQELSSKAAILIVVLSPRYVNSEWCRREMEIFIQVANQTGGVLVKNWARIFKVERTPVPLENQFKELRGITGYRFYRHDGAEQRIREFIPGIEEGSLDAERMDELARDLANLLITMKERGYGRSANESLAQRMSSREDYDVFISYRRQNGASEARLIRAELRSDNIKAFLDVDDLGAGHFDEALLNRIADIRSFIVVLSPNCLDRCGDERDWLRLEIAQALKTSRNVIPVMLPGFEFPEPQSLPVDIRALSSHQAVRYSHEYFDAMITKVNRYLHTEKAG